MRNTIKKLFILSSIFFSQHSLAVLGNDSNPEITISNPSRTDTSILENKLDDINFAVKRFFSLNHRGSEIDKKIKTIINTREVRPTHLTDRDLFLYYEPTGGDRPDFFDLTSPVRYAKERNSPQVPLQETLNDLNDFIDQLNKLESLQQEVVGPLQKQRLNEVKRNIIEKAENSYARSSALYSFFSTSNRFNEGLDEYYKQSQSRAKQEIRRFKNS